MAAFIIENLIGKEVSRTNSKGFIHLPCITRWVDDPYAFVVGCLSAVHDAPWVNPEDLEYAKKRGNTIYYPTQDEMKLWYDAAKPLRENWITRYEKEGLPARKVSDRLTQLIDEYKK